MLYKTTTIANIKRIYIKFHVGKGSGDST